MSPEALCIIEGPKKPHSQRLPRHKIGGTSKVLQSSCSSHFTHTRLHRFLLIGRSILPCRNAETDFHYFALFFLRLASLAFSISASFSAFFLSSSACLTFSSCAFRNSRTKFKRVAVTCSNGHRAGSSPK